ncbi:hypothetical protein ACQJBY_024194 [Aegilops geniculata]
MLLAEQATGAIGANPGNGEGANPLQPAPASSTRSAAAGLAQRASTTMWRRARWIARGRGSARRARHLNLPRADIPMAGGSGAEAGHYREEFHRRKDGVARVRRAGAVEAGSPPMLSSSSCRRPASLDSSVLTSTSPRSRARRGLRQLGHGGTDARGSEAIATARTAEQATASPSWGWAGERRSPPLSPGWFSPGRRGASRCGGC